MALHSPRHVEYYNPATQIYVGLWMLFSGATVFLALRLWSKFTRRHGLWYDDYVLIVAYLVLLTTDIIISVEYATNYAAGYWDDRMHILINTSSMGTIIGQAVSKTAFGVTLLRMTETNWQRAILWFCIVSMDSIALSKCVFQWAKLCERDDYQQWYRIQGWCLGYAFAQEWKEIGNIYNIVMDFIFALYPWFITWKLNLKRAEKIGLSITLSLGMVVAIITAVRTWWKDTPLMHVHDRWYIWRDAMSQIWYSAEVAGTIIVQCVPVLRPFIKELHTSLTSRRLQASTSDQPSGGAWRGSTLVERKNAHTAKSLLADDEEAAALGSSKGGGGGAGYELMDIPEESTTTTTTYAPHKYGYGYSAPEAGCFSPAEVEQRIQASHTKPLGAPRQQQQQQQQINTQNWPL